MNPKSNTAEQENKSLRTKLLGRLTTVNVCAALVLLCIALPLNVGVAIASGVPPEFGIMSGVVASLVSGILSSSGFLISGPDAGIGVLVLDVIRKFGLQNLGAIVLLSGIIQIVLGLSNSAKWFKALSPALINGMLAGMGLLIIFTQFHIMLDDSPKESGLMNMVLIPETLIKSLSVVDGSAHFLAAVLSVSAIAIAILWARFAPGKLRTIPNVLVTIIAISSIACWLKLPVNYVDFPTSMTQNMAPLTLSSLFSCLTRPDILTAAFMLAFVCSAQSLITLSALDPNASRGNSKHDRELIAQGIGNSICGMLGILPIVGVLLRSVANKQNGATDNTPNILHGLLMVAVILFAPQLLKAIPSCVLSATLVLIGFRMVSNILGQIKGYEKGELTIFALTACAIIATNLFTGVLIGFVLAATKAFIVLSNLDIRVEESADSNVITLHLSGAATFVALPQLTEVLGEIDEHQVLHLNLDNLRYMDHACLQQLTQWERQHKGKLFIDWDQSPTDINTLPRYARRHRAKPEEWQELRKSGVAILDNA
ncbi:MAG TPA: SulP family inorganic anion transporter [Candidatus Melainabacteria bacterium]|nr:SulP family inorganic anion transporter [Candidatus Melainabacteria bacterium]